MKPRELCSTFFCLLCLRRSRRGCQQQPSGGPYEKDLNYIRLPVYLGRSRPQLASEIIRAAILSHLQVLHLNECKPCLDSFRPTWMTGTIHRKRNTKKAGLASLCFLVVPFRKSRFRSHKDAWYIESQLQNGTSTCSIATQKSTAVGATRTHDFPVISGASALSPAFSQCDSVSVAHFTSRKTTEIR